MCNLVHMQILESVWTKCQVTRPGELKNKQSEIDTISSRLSGIFSHQKDNVPG
jgi:hypothetical protein